MTTSPNIHVLFPVLNADTDRLAANEFLLSDIKQSTMRAYRCGLNLYFDFLKNSGKTVATANSIDIVMFKKWLTTDSKYSKSTQFVYFEAVKRYYKFLSANGGKDCAAGIKGVTMEMALGRIPISMKEFKKMIDSIKANVTRMNNVNGKRNYALLLTYGMTGMRTESICKLKWSDLMRKPVATKADDEIIEFRDFIQYEKKGRGTRIGYNPIDPRLFTALMHLREEVENKYEYLDENWYIFVKTVGDNDNLRLPDVPSTTHMANGSLRNLVTKVMKDAGIYEAGIKSPHSLRHAFAMYMLRETNDMEIVKELLGHSSTKYTGIYTRLQTQANVSDAIIESKVFNRVFED